MKQILPPRHFKPAGVVTDVRYSAEQPAFVTDKPRKGSRGRGLAYEKKVQGHLASLYDYWYVPSPWFTYRTIGDGRVRWCQPDGLIFLPYLGKIVIVEIKLQHTANAWWQLKWLYLPVMAEAFRKTLWDFALCEVVKWYDPATVFPEKVKLKANILETQPDEFGVHIWRP